MIATRIDFVGRTLAERYDVTSVLGEGNMGRVYLARDANLDVDVVIKVPSEESLRDPEFVARFAIESRSMVRLTHPHVVNVIDQGKHEEDGDDIPYVVMQYLSGGSLKDRAAKPDGKRGRMAVSTLRSWLLEVAKALDFMHGQQYIHRDVKPANILFDQHGNPFLSDFGLAKVLSAREDTDANELTAAGFLVGTPNYVAPELVMGEPANAAADQYSLAITVYEVLTGRCPMEGPTASATMVNQTTRRPPAPTSIVRTIPKALSRVILAALSKTPADRFATCTAFAEAALAAAAATGPRPAVPRNAKAARRPAREAERDAEYEYEEEASATLPRLPPRQRSKGRGKRRVSKGTRGRVRCPACNRVLPLKEEHAGRRGRCIHCRARLEVGHELDSLRLLGGPAKSVTPGGNSGDTAAASSDNTARTEVDDLVIGERLFGLNLSKRTAITLFAILIAVLVTVGIMIASFLRYDPDRERDEELRRRHNVDRETIPTAG